MMGGKTTDTIATNTQASLGTTGLSSPYLNFNPAFVAPNEDSQYIFPEGADSHGRGRFELMFSTIGGFTAAGGAIGGLNGAFAGLKATKDMSGPARKTQMINFVAKRSASWAQMCGVVALMYSGTATALSKIRGHDDELNTVAAGTISGLLFKSTAGLKRCATGGAVGFGITAAYILLTSDRIGQMHWR